MSGTGSGFEFLRNSSLDARDYFANREATRPALRQNQFGASLGGPIWRNRAFFFTDYEGFRKRQERVSVNTVPTLPMRRGDFSASADIFDPWSTRPATDQPAGIERSPLPNRIIPTSRFDSVAGRLINAYPLPETAASANNHRSFPKLRQDWNHFDLRLDANLSGGDAAFARYSRQRTLTALPSTFGPVSIEGISQAVSLGDEDPAGLSDLTVQHAVFSWTRVLSPTLLLEARVGVTRFDSALGPNGVEPGDRLGERLGVPNANQGPFSDGIPIFRLRGYSGIGHSRAIPTIRGENSWNPKVHFTRSSGNRTLKVGFSMIQRRISDYQTSWGNGGFTFDGSFTGDPNRAGATGETVASFLLGAASGMEQDLLFVRPNIEVMELGVYAQHDWNVTPRLALNAGLRYELDTPPSEAQDRWLNFDVLSGDLRIAGFNSDRRVGVRADANNVSPRFGLAYRLSDNRVIRAGYGIYYNTQGNGRVSFRLHRQAPFGPSLQETSDSFSVPFRRIQDGFRPAPIFSFHEAATSPAGSVIGLADNFKSGYAQQITLQHEHELSNKNAVLSAAYVANLSRQLQTFYDFNQPVPGPGSPASRRPLRHTAPNVTEARYGVSDGLGNYHALQLSARRRFAEGLGFSTSYTWSHSIDNVPNEQGGGANGPVPQDRRNRAAERATSGFDIQHRLVQAIHFQTPFGSQSRPLGPAWATAALADWVVGAIFTWQTGLPFTPTLLNSVSNAGDSRPDRRANGRALRPDPGRWFDADLDGSSAPWATPRPFHFGDSGRNVLRGPGRINLDVSLARSFVLSEGLNLQLRTEFYNLFNTPQLDLPNAILGSPKAGTITVTAGTSRQMQLGVRLAF